ncbi:permease [Clostridia bacterium]|nr:permease [Clostridia bacterium]
MSIENNSYRNFDIAIYLSDKDMVRVEDDVWLEESFAVISKNIKIGKIYLETFRAGVATERKYLEKAISFFQKKGITRISGGIMASRPRPDAGRSFCYTDPAEREQFRQIIEYTAGMFDELILDDLFTFYCRCEKCREARGDRSWTQYRMDVMEEVYKELVIKAARAVNPNINLIIKYPNWYEQYQLAGYNLEAGPRLMDQYYTGTETRDSENTNQHLQIYQSYNIMRYFDHMRPGLLGGGWVDPVMPGSLNRFAQQFDLTLFAKPKETTIWSYGLLLDYIKKENGGNKILGLKAAVAGDSFEKADSFLDQLGQPIGVASYKPYHSFGESYIHNYIGMIGIPIDLYPEFPESSPTVFLSAQAAYDRDIVPKIEKQLENGKTVIITSQLYKALLDRGIKRVAEIDYTDKKVLSDKFVLGKTMGQSFTNVYKAEKPILFTQLNYGLLEGEELAQCVTQSNRFPVIISYKGYEKGKFYIVNMPEDMGDLYNLPSELLSLLRYVFMADIPVRLDGPAKTCLFVYDNSTFIAQSFLRYTADCVISVKKPGTRLVDLISDEVIESRYCENGEAIFKLALKPESYSVFRIQ